MSLFTAPLSNFTIEKHPNADSLSIAQVGGWQCVVRTEDFKNETMGVYIPLQAIAAIDHPLLSFLKGKRVETCKLRGVISQGVLLPYSSVVDYMKNNLGMSDESIQKVTIEGRNFAGILRIKKWEDTSIRFRNGGNTESPHPDFHKYTDIENIKNFTNILKIGEFVHISEKIHGASARFAYIDGKFMIASRNNQLKIDDGPKSLWHFIYDKYNLREKLLDFHERCAKSNVAIYGEIAGPRVQDLHYGQKEPELFVYDLIVNGVFLSPRACELMCNALNLRMCPVLKIGPLEEKDFELRKGQSTLADHHREGIVIKPLEPRWDPELGRVILKVISEEYLMRKGATDFVDS